MQFIDPSLPRELFGWRSPALDMDMPIVCYGHAGHPLLVYPTAQADFLENERFFLIKSIESAIFAGKIRVFSIDSINRHAWMNESVHPLEAGRRQALYSSYVEEEVVPHIQRVSGGDTRVAVTGASFGAFHAANQFFRRPDLFDTLIAMSGFYDLDGSYTDGHLSDDIYFNNPIAYLSNLGGEQLDRLRHDTDIHIVSGRGAYEAPHCSVKLASVLNTKGVPNSLDLWGYDVDHDWPWWRRMLPHYIDNVVRW